VLLEGIVLKPNMVLSGYQCPEQATVDEVAERTLACLREAVPAAVPGIAFLSGGQSDELATERLDAMNRLGGVPWELTFSYGRGLLAGPLNLWAGDDSKVEEAQGLHLHRARCTAAARRGAYEKAMEEAVA
jgi:fructose-bisphosphate aldolase class I